MSEEYDRGYQAGAQAHVEHHQCQRCYNEGHAAGVREERERLRTMLDAPRMLRDDLRAREG